MSCKTAILRAVFDSPTVQEAAANGVINLPDVTSNTRCATATGGTISIREPGDYGVAFNATLVAAAAGPVEVQMHRNGSPVPGAHAIGQAAAAGDNVPLAFDGVITVECCGNESISFRATTAATVRIANAVVEKLK